MDVLIIRGKTNGSIQRVQLVGDGEEDVPFNELFGMTDGLGGWLSDLFMSEWNSGL